MTKENILRNAVLPGLLAAAAVVLSLTIPFSVSADGLAGYGTVLFLLSIAVLEYRISWKRITSFL